MILKSREDNKSDSSGQEAGSLQQSSSRSGVVDHGCGRVGGDGGDFEGGA